MRGGEEERSGCEGRREGEGSRGKRRHGHKKEQKEERTI